MGSIWRPHLWHLISAAEQGAQSKYSWNQLPELVSLSCHVGWHERWSLTGDMPGKARDLYYIYIYVCVGFWWFLPGKTSEKAYKHYWNNQRIHQLCIFLPLQPASLLGISVYPYLPLSQVRFPFFGIVQSQHKPTITTQRSSEFWSGHLSKISCLWAQTRCFLVRLSYVFPNPIQKSEREPGRPASSQSRSALWRWPFQSPPPGQSQDHQLQEGVGWRT